MSGGGGYNDWESDLSSIIEKTNQNLKLLRRIGDKRTDLGGSSGYDVSTTSGTRPASSSSSAAQIASDMRSFASSISNRYAAEESAAAASRHHRHASTTSIPRAASASTAASSSRKLHRSSSVEVDARARARESLIIRPATHTSSNAFGATSDGENESDEQRSPRVRHATSASRTSASSGGGGATLKRSSSLAAKTSRNSSSGGARPTATAPAAYGGSGNSSSTNQYGTADGVALDELRKSLEVHIASRSSAFEKALADLRTDMTVVTSEANTLGMKMQELRDAVHTKLRDTSATATAVAEHSESIARLEKHSAVLLGWKVGVDQDLFEISSKLKSFVTIQEKVNSLEGHLSELGAAIKTAHRSSRHDEKIDELRDRIATLERQAAHQLDAKAVEHTVQMRVSKEINEHENRFTQSLQFLTQKIEGKLQSLEKTLQSDRIDAIAAVKSELLDDVDKLESRVVKKPELTPIQNAHTQMRDDIAHMQLFFERQDKRFQELKQNSSQIRDELVETRHELTKALHAQQSRVSTTLEEKVGQLTILTKDKNAKAEQKVAVLEKRFKKVEDQCKHLQDAVSKVKQDALTRQAVDTIAQQRENEKLRQRLLRSIAELEQLQTAKQELERSAESQDRQYQTKLKELRAQIDEQERLKEALRTEMLQAIQNESRQIGVAQGRNALLESLLAREKQESEEKAQHVHKSRQEIAQVRHKMRMLENDVDKKMQKLSGELQTKQAQIDTLTKKLARSEDEALKLTESAKREKKLLAKTKELKQQELVATKLKLRELEKVAAASLASMTQTRSSVDVPPVPMSQRVDEDLTPRLAELELKGSELQSLLTERVAEVEELKCELQEMRSERQDLMQTHQEMLDAEVKRLNIEYERKIDALERDVVAKEAELVALRESLVDKSEFDALADALALVRREKESLLEQLQAAQADHTRELHEAESLLRGVHSTEMESLRSQIELRLVEIAAAEETIHALRERVATLESEMRLTGETHKHEITRLANELKVATLDVERLVEEMEQLRIEKADAETKLGEMQITLESISAGDEELLEEMDNLRQQYEEITAERDRLIEGLRAKADEVAELTQLEATHRDKIAEIVQVQKETSTRLERELEAMRETIERERDAAAESERHLQRSIDVLRVEADAAKQQADDGATDTTRLEQELATTQQQLERVLQSETSLKERLAGIMTELAAVGADVSDEADPSRLLRSHVASVAEKHTQELAALSTAHDLARKEATAERDRALTMETQIRSLSEQIDELESGNAELKAELERQCSEFATRAQEMGCLQEEMATARDEKHALEEQVAELSAHVEELDATLQSQAQEKRDEVDELKASNAKLTTTVGDIRETMERLERDKMAELDGLNIEIHELETMLVAMNERPRGSSGHAVSMEKEFFTNQQTIATAGQSIRSLFAKLSSGCSVIDLQELKASLLAVEDKRGKTREQLGRDRRRLAEADQDVLLHVEFLDALVQDADKNEFALATKYMEAAPALARRLGQLQELYCDALEQCRVVSAVAVPTGDKHERTEEEIASPASHNDCEDTNDDIASELEEEELDEAEESAELSSSQGVDLDESWGNHAGGGHDDSEDDRNAQGDASPTQSLRDEAMAKVVEADSPARTTVERRMELSLDVGGARADACTSLISSPTAAQLSTEPFQARRTIVSNTVGAGAVAPLDVSLVPRAGASTTLLHSPTAALLERRFQPASTEPARCQLLLDDEDDEVEETSTGSPCTSVPTSPTNMLLQERFQPRHTLAAGSQELDHHESPEASEDGSDDGAQVDDRDAESDHDHFEDHTANIQPHDRLIQARDDLSRRRDDVAESDDSSIARDRSLAAPSRDRDSADNDELDREDNHDAMISGRDDDELDQNGMDDDDELNQDDEHALSQSLESMVRLVAGDESVGQDARSASAHSASVYSASDESGDQLIDEDSDEEPSEDDNHSAQAAPGSDDQSCSRIDALAESATAASEDEKPEESATQAIGDLSDEERDTDLDSPSAGVFTLPVDSSQGRATVDTSIGGMDDADASADDDEPTHEVVESTLTVHQSPPTLHDEHDEFDDVSDADASLDESLECSAAESANLSQAPSTVSPLDHTNDEATRSPLGSPHLEIEALARVGGGDGHLVDDDDRISASGEGDDDADEHADTMSELGESHDGHELHNILETGLHTAPGEEDKVDRNVSEHSDDDIDVEEEDEVSCSEFDASTDLDHSTAPIGERDDDDDDHDADEHRYTEMTNFETTRRSNEAERCDGSDVNADEHVQPSPAISFESSPIKQSASALPAVPSLALSRIAALRSESDDEDDELHAAQLAMDAQRRGLGHSAGHDEFGEQDDDEFGEQDGEDDEAAARLETATEAETTRASAMATDPAKWGMSLEKTEARNDNLDDEDEALDDAVSMGEASHDDDDALIESVRTHHRENVEEATSRNVITEMVDGDVLSARGVPCGDDEHDDVEELGSDHELDASHEIDQEDSALSLDVEVSPDAFAAKEEPIGDEPNRTLLGERDDHEHLGFSAAAPDAGDEDEDDDADFDRVLSAAQDDDSDGENGDNVAVDLEQSSSFDVDRAAPRTIDPQYNGVSEHDGWRRQDEAEDEDEEEPKSDRGFGEEEDSMDEVERLLLQHAEGAASPVEKALESGDDRHFSSSLRMEDEEEDGDDDELIDSESDDDGDEQQLSVSESGDQLADSMASESGVDRHDASLDAHELDASTDSRDHEDADRAAATTSSSRSFPSLPEGKSHEHDAAVTVDDDEDSSSDEDHGDAAEDDRSIMTPHGKAERAVTGGVATGRDGMSSFGQAPRAALRNFDESDEDDDDASRGEQDEQSRPAPVTRLAAQLPPLAGLGLGGRARGVGGSGSLMKALQATRGAMGSSDLDDDMDEGEQLMATQSQQRPRPISDETTLSAPTSLTSHVKDHDFDDDDDEGEDESEQPTEPLAATSMCDVDDEMDEVERRMATQIQRATPAPKCSVARTTKTRDEELDDDEGDEELDRDDTLLSVAPTTRKLSATSDASVGGHADSAAVPEVDHAQEDEEHDDTLIDDDDAQDDALFDDEDDDDASFDEASGTFGMSFGDDVLERALEGAPKPAHEPVRHVPTTPATSTTAIASRHLVDSHAQENSDDDDDAELHRTPIATPALLAPSSFLLGQNRRQLGALQPLPALGKTPLPGLNSMARSGRRVEEDDDDDMDEVERLLLEQSTMKTSKPSTTAVSSQRYDAAVEDDDEFDDDATSDAAASPQRRRTETELSQSASSETEALGSAPGSPSRIPILPGSSLLQKKPLLTAPASPLSAALAAPPVHVSRTRMASARSDGDDGDDAYLEDSFDLEESLQDDNDDDV